MITGLILPATAALLLFVSIKTTDGFQLANGAATAGLLLALILDHTTSWASTLALGMYILLILGLLVLLAYAHFMD